MHLLIALHSQMAARAQEPVKDTSVVEPSRFEWLVGALLSWPQTDLVLAGVGMGVFWVLARIAARYGRAELWLVAALIPCWGLAQSLVLGVLGWDNDYFTFDRAWVGAIAITTLWWWLHGRVSRSDPRIPPERPFDPKWIVALPVSGLILLQIQTGWETVGLRWPAFIAAAQLAVVGILWAVWRSRSTADVIAGSPQHVRRESAPDVRPAAAPEPIRAAPSPEPHRPAPSPEPVRPAPAAARAPSPEPVAPADAPRGTKPEPSPPSPSPRASSPPVAPSSGVRSGRLFISYRREDSADVTGRIYDRLVNRFGKEQVFKDVDSIPLGVDFRKHLQQVVGTCDIVLAVLGQEWLSSPNPRGGRRIDDSKDFVRIELEAALQRDIPVIPVLVRGASVPLEGDLPEPLAAFAYRNGMPVRADPDFHHDMDRLIEGVEAHVAQRPT